MIEHSLSITEYAIIDVLAIAPTWCKPEIINNDVYYWVARQKLSDELKAFNLKPDTVYRHFKNLCERGFIDYEKVGKKDVMKLTEKSKNMITSTMSEINPNELGNKSENNSEINPTYNNTNTNNNTILIKDIMSDLNNLLGKNFKVEVHKDLVQSLINKGYSLDDFKHVHMVKLAEWKGTEQEKYLNPTTLYRPKNFDKYLNQDISNKDKYEMVRNKLGLSHTEMFERGYANG